MPTWGSQKLNDLLTNEAALLNKYSWEEHRNFLLSPSHFWVILQTTLSSLRTSNIVRSKGLFKWIYFSQFGFFIPQKCKVITLKCVALIDSHKCSKETGSNGARKRWRHRLEWTFAASTVHPPVQTSDPQMHSSHLDFYYFCAKTTKG